MHFLLNKNMPYIEKIELNIDELAVPSFSLGERAVFADSSGWRMPSIDGDQERIEESQEGIVSEDHRCQRAGAQECAGIRVVSDHGGPG
jgi:hypothetical protein